MKNPFTRLLKRAFETIYPRGLDGLRGRGEIEALHRNRERQLELRARLGQRKVAQWGRSVDTRRFHASSLPFKEYPLPREIVEQWRSQSWRDRVAFAGWVLMIIHYHRMERALLRKIRRAEVRGDELTRCKLYLRLANHYCGLSGGADPASIELLDVCLALAADHDEWRGAKADAYWHFAWCALGSGGGSQRESDYRRWRRIEADFLLQCIEAEVKDGEFQWTEECVRRLMESDLDDTEKVKIWGRAKSLGALTTFIPPVEIYEQLNESKRAHPS